MEPKQYLATLIAPLVVYPDHVHIESTTDERGILLTLVLHKEDMGPIIGKQGDTARAVRRLVRQFGMAHKAHVSLKINEPEA